MDETGKTNKDGWDKIQICAAVIGAVVAIAVGVKSLLADDIVSGPITTSVDVTTPLPQKLTTEIDSGPTKPQHVDGKELVAGVGPSDPVSQPPEIADQPKVMGDVAMQPSKPSFDCARLDHVYTAQEQMICHSGTLSRLDVSLSTAYERSRAHLSMSQRNKLKIDQRRWMSSRAVCVNADCLEEMYRSRLEELERMH